MTQVSGARQGDYHQAIERLFNEGSVSGLSEAQLLERFAARNDESAFEALVERHGPMVLGVCRRFLRDPNDVDDAFQAVFLILVRKAGGLRQKELLGNWLYGVACRVAVRARALAARRQAKAASSGDAERLAVDHRRPSSEEPWEALIRDEGRSWLHEEVERLPRRYRQPVVACYFEGRTHEEAATLLGCPLGTVKGRLSLARDLLRKRLERRGLAVPAVALAAQLASSDLRAAVPVPLAHGTVRSGLALTTTGASLMTTSAISTTVRTLTEGVLHAMVITHIKAVAIPAILVSAGLLAAGATVVARQDAGDKPVPEPVTARPETVRKATIVARPEYAADPKPAPGSGVDDVAETEFGLTNQLDVWRTRYQNLQKMLASESSELSKNSDKDKAAALYRGRVGALLRSIENEKPASEARRKLKAAFIDYVRKDLDWKGPTDKPGRGGTTGPAKLNDLAHQLQASREQLQEDLKALQSPQDKEAARDLHELSLKALTDAAGPSRQPLRDLYDAYLAALDQAAENPKTPPAVAEMAKPPKSAAPANPPQAVPAAAVSDGGFGGGGGATDEPSAEQYRLQIARASAALSKLDKSPMNQAVLKALENPITLRSTEKTTLGQMLKQIKDSVRTADGKKIPIYVDPVALSDVDKTLDVPVVIDLEDVPIKFSLRLMLKQLGLAYCVRDGVLIISSLEGVQQELMEVQSEQMGLDPMFPTIYPMGGMGGGMGGMGGGQGMM